MKVAYADPPYDEFTDLFPGSGAVGRAWTRWSTGTLPLDQGLWALDGVPE